MNQEKMKKENKITNNQKPAFLIWADGDENMIPVVQGLEKVGYKVIYWVGLPGKGIDSARDAIFHHHENAWVGKPAESLKDNFFSPPGISLIEKFYKLESVILTMMHKRFDSLWVDARRHLYYKMLAYWDGVFQMFKPEAIVFPTVPHTVYNYIIYELAKFYGIKTVMFEDTWVGDRMLLYTDWVKGSSAFQGAIKKNLGRVRKENLSPELQEYFETQTKTQRADATPIYMTHWKKQNSKWNQFLKKLKNAKGAIQSGTFFKRAFSFALKIGKPTLKTEYEALTKNPDLNIPFVYVPLGFQPERTTSPQGDVYVDQILMIETIAKALPEGYKVYVKEHPSQWWLRTGTRYNSARYPGYYRTIASIPNVILVPIHTNSFNLILNSKAVGVVTGTAGFEAILRGKSVLLFGYPWYRDYPDLFRITDSGSCKDALLKIKNGFAPKKSTTISFLKSLEDSCIRGYIEGFVDKISKLSNSESRKNIVEAMINELTL